MDYFKPIFIQVKFNVADGLPRRLTTQNQVIFPLILPFCNKIVKSLLIRLFSLYSCIFVIHFKIQLIKHGK